MLKREMWAGCCNLQAAFECKKYIAGTQLEAYCFATGETECLCCFKKSHTSRVTAIFLWHVLGVVSKVYLSFRRRYASEPIVDSIK